jgi:hypothetical protein
VRDALRWVFPPHRSMHVRGLAVDIDSGPGADWLERHGAASLFIHHGHVGLRRDQRFVHGPLALAKRPQLFL